MVRLFLSIRSGRKYEITLKYALGVLKNPRLWYWSISSSACYNYTYLIDTTVLVPVSHHLAYYSTYSQDTILIAFPFHVLALGKCMALY